MDLNSNYFRAIQGSTGCNNKKDVKVAEIKKRFNKNFDDSMGVTYDATRNNIKQDFIITALKNGDCTIKPRCNEELNIGDIIFWNNIHWLVTERSFYDNLYNNHIMTICNREIRWQNPITNEIISRWCFAERPYANGIKDGNIVSTPDRQFRIQLPYDNETIQIDIGKRFVLETIAGKQKVYKLLMPDLNTNKFQDSEGGFIVWNLEFDNNIDPKRDNVELGICDFISPIAPPPIIEDPVLLNCSITGSPTIRCGGSIRTYKPSFYTADGITLDTNVIPIWNILLSAKQEEKIILRVNDNFIEINCAEDATLINTKFTITLVDEIGVYNKAELEVKVVSAF